jgi:hypothetical protein
MSEVQLLSQVKHYSAVLQMLHVYQMDNLTEIFIFLTKNNYISMIMQHSTPLLLVLSSDCYYTLEKSW